MKKLQLFRNHSNNSVVLLIPNQHRYVRFNIRANSKPLMSTWLRSKMLYRYLFLHLGMEQENILSFYFIFLRGKVKMTFLPQYRFLYKHFTKCMSRWEWMFVLQAVVWSKDSTYEIRFYSWTGFRNDLNSNLSIDLITHRLLTRKKTDKKKKSISSLSRGKT